MEKAFRITDNNDRKPSVISKVGIDGKAISQLSVGCFNRPKNSEVYPEELRDQYTCTCQIVRSSGQWSMGLQENQVERSIQMAYIDMITNAEHFIYIENQFFVSSTSGKPVSNKIGEAIILRLRRAMQERQKFKLIICLPLLPGFEGDIDDKAGNVMRIQLGWLFHTLARGDSSIIGAYIYLT